jgi:hypothetical protein
MIQIVRPAFFLGFNLLDENYFRQKFNKQELTISGMPKQVLLFLCSMSLKSPYAKNLVSSPWHYWG